MLSYLVTGGAGMIGSHMAERLLERGNRVTVVDDLSSGSIQNIRHLRRYNTFHFVEGDLRDPAVALENCKGKDVVIALAATMGGMLMISTVHADIMRDNVLMNVNTLEAARRAKVPLYFFSSSACAYNIEKQTDPNNSALKESDAFPGLPNEHYGWEKLFSEVLCDAYTKDYGMNIRIARFHNVYGSAFTAFDKLKAKAPCRMIIDCLTRDCVEVWNDGEQTRSFLYIDDCVNGVLTLLESQYKNPVNIGSDRLVTMNEFARLVIDLSGKKIKPTYFPDKPMGVRGRNADLTLVRKELNWEPRVSLEEGMRYTYHWAKSHLSELEGVK